MNRYQDDARRIHAALATLPTARETYWREGGCLAFAAALQDRLLEIDIPASVVISHLPEDPGTYHALVRAAGTLFDHRGEQPGEIPGEVLREFDAAEEAAAYVDDRVDLRMRERILRLLRVAF